MKYLFINVLAGSGSTGKIAAAKCRELQKQGHQCVLAYGRGEANCEDIRTYKIGTKLDYCIHGVKTRLFDRHGFGSVRATKKFLKWVRVYDPDVIWLHNIHGYYINIEMLFDYLKSTDKKVYWTLHDCWAFTGHCTYFSYVKCDKWKTGCHNCNQKNKYPGSFLLDRSRKNYIQKKKIFLNVSDLTIFTPSKWLEKLVKESFLKGYRTEVIYNKVETKVFRPVPSHFREQYGLKDKRIILGVANVWEKRKGLDDFIKLAELLNEQYAIVLVGLNERMMQNVFHRLKRVKKPKRIYAEKTNICGVNNKKKGCMAIPPGIESLYRSIVVMFGEDIQESEQTATVICLKRTESAGELAQIYTAADVFVNPTYEDNYPTVNLEAQACGTRVITYDVGGCRETIGL